MNGLRFMSSVGRSAVFPKRVEPVGVAAEPNANGLFSDTGVAGEDPNLNGVSTDGEATEVVAGCPKEKAGGTPLKTDFGGSDGTGVAGVEVTIAVEGCPNTKGALGASGVAGTADTADTPERAKGVEGCDVIGGMPNS